LSSFLECENDEKELNCVTGKAALKSLYKNDYYPEKLIDCTNICYNKSTSKDNSFFKNFTYLCQQGCKQNGKPNPDPFYDKM